MRMDRWIQPAQDASSVPGRVFSNSPTWSFLLLSAEVGGSARPWHYLADIHSARVSPGEAVEDQLPDQLVDVTQEGTQDTACFSVGHQVLLTHTDTAARSRLLLWNEWGRMRALGVKEDVTEGLLLLGHPLPSLWLGDKIILKRFLSYASWWFQIEVSTVAWDAWEELRNPKSSAGPSSSPEAILLHLSESSCAYLFCWVQDVF